MIERILFLDGIPNMQRLSPVRVGEEPVEQHRVDLELELEAVERINIAIALCRDRGDNGTRELLDEILEDEEESVDWLEAQLHLVKEVGRERYLAAQINRLARPNARQRQSPLFSAEGVSPAQPLETSEITIGRDELAGVLDGERSQIGVAHERTCDLGMLTERRKQLPAFIVGLRVAPCHSCEGSTTARALSRTPRTRGA